MLLKLGRRGRDRLSSCLTLETKLLPTDGSSTGLAALLPVFPKIDRLVLVEPQSIRSPHQNGECFKAHLAVSRVTPPRPKAVRLLCDSTCFESTGQNVAAFHPLREYHLSAMAEKTEVGRLEISDGNHR